MKNIKNLPIVVLQALKEFINSVDKKKNRLCHIADQESFLVRFVDNDLSSGFYFNIERHDTNGLLVGYKPMNASQTADHRRYSSLGEIANIFSGWYDCLIAYDELSDFYDDPFLKKFEEEFLTDINLNEQAQNEPLTLKQILFLEEFLSKIESEITKYQNQINTKQIEEISQEAIYIQSQLGKQTKGWHAKRISKLFAKIVQEGPGILKDIFKEVGKEIMLQGVKYLLDKL